MSKHLGVEYKVRMPQELKDKIAESAKELNRSMNADIVARLEKSFEEPMSFNPNDAEMVTKLVAQSMQHLLIALHEQGVDSEKLMQAVSKVAEK